MSQLTQLELSAWRGLLRTHDALWKTLDAQLVRDSSMTLSAYEVLLLLEEAGESGVRMTQLAQTLGFSGGGLTRLADKLQAEGYIERRRPEADGRGQEASLTPAGRAKLKRVHVKHLRNVRAVFLDHVTAEEQQVLANIWKRLADVRSVAAKDARKESDQMNTLQTTGLHHVSALTRQVGKNHDFYTGVLGLRLVKKTVNQDDTRMYHMFYADQAGAPGTDMTFFDFPQVAPERKGNNSITRTTFRVTGAEAMQYWVGRFDRLRIGHSGIVTRDGRLHVDFEDVDGTPLSLVDDDGLGPRGTSRAGSGIPDAFQIQGLGYGGITVPDLALTRDFFERGLSLREVRQYPAAGNDNFLVHVFEMGPTPSAGPHAELHVTERDDLPRVVPGAGGVHHIALRVPDEVGIQPWLDHFEREGFRNTGLIDRFYFRSVYIRDRNGITIELATEGPGFAVDEASDVLGEQLALPPFLEAKRTQIEAQLVPIVTAKRL